MTSHTDCRDGRDPVGTWIQLWDRGALTHCHVLNLGSKVKDFFQDGAGAVLRPQVRQKWSVFTHLSLMLLDKTYTQGSMDGM